MAKQILVPVDVPVTIDSGAHALAGLVADIARSSGAAVRLLHVAPWAGNVETPEGRVVSYADQEMDRAEAEAIAALRTIAEPHLDGVAVECVVRFGDPVEQILREAEVCAADLIVVGTKTRSSLSRALLGSVAEGLVRRAPISVVVVRPAP